MTVTIVPNTGKSSAGEVALRAAQILRSHGAAVLMDQALQPAFNLAGVQYLPFDDCLHKTDVILTIGGDGTILHVANLTLNYHMYQMLVGDLPWSKIGQCWLIGLGWTLVSTALGAALFARQEIK